MARENYVLLHGQIYKNASTMLDTEGNVKRVTLALKVIRRPFLTGEGQVAAGTLHIDYPIIITTDPVLTRIAADFKEGDMVDIRGVLTTREIKKIAYCPNGHEVSWLGNFVFVTPIYICPRERGLSETDGLQLLRERAEISNVVMIIGTLCRDPILHEYEDRKGCMAQYQIASNRRYHIRDGHEAERTDYPWIKTVNKQALEDFAHLKTNSTVFINGAIQSREVERTITCEACGEEFLLKEAVAEIFPYSVEYLMNCIFEPKPGNEAEAAPAG